MLWLLAFSVALWASGDAESRVFQGSCSSSSVVCDEICISLHDETYECGCWNERPLNDDGISCRVLAASDHHSLHHAKPKTRRVEIVDDSWMETIKTETPSDNLTNETRDGVLAFDSHNYAHFIAPESAYLETNVSIEFRSDSLDDGLLFFGGMYTEEDFISLAIVGGNIVLRYDCGEGISTETYFGPFSLHRWHAIRVKRKYCTRSEIIVDAMATIMDNNKEYTNYKGISMADGFFVGGVPSNVEFLEGKTTVTRGFKGCVRRLSVNEMTLLDASRGVNSMLNRDMIKSCSVENNTKRKEESEGMVVRKIDHHHVEKRILETTTATTTKKTSTSAPTTTTVKAVVPSAPRNLSVEFDGGLFLEQPSPIEIEQYIDLEIHFKPKKNKGLIFHWEDRSHRLSVFLLDGFVEVEMSLGGDESLLKSPSPVSLNAWHSVQVYRSGKGILMKVDKQRFVDTEVDSTDRRQIKAGSTFIGGSNIKLPATIQAVGNYVGCMKKIRLNSHLLSLAHAPSRTADADRATALPLALPTCSSDPCSSRGKCGPHDCAATEDLTKYSCLCPFPSFGERCGSTFSMAEGAMRLRGDGMLLLNDAAVMEHITGDSLKFSMEIKQNGTISKEQILAYAGDLEDDDDFMQIGLSKERKVVVSMNLGAGEVQLTHPRPIPPGKWATVDVVRTRRSIRVTVDGEAPVTAEAPAGSEQLNVYDAISIGGRESHVHLREDGFDGCIEWIKIDDTVITSPRQATKSINVEPCHSLP
ncbi:hypothetical protein PENTCL1PPCAC_4437 [Pristionchus entomophagus]|uniref:Laminin G domain-containing protein n=1 Tax=Pristionchus entomophagus TaxID=358040 RepID=A0AAV5SI05_9BILA|nr:hypothetical protein PENTCL1PPCAC_4437 [Pristionchus entomophagus]